MAWWVCKVIGARSRDSPWHSTAQTHTRGRLAGWQTRGCPIPHLQTAMEAAQGRMDCSIHGLSTRANARPAVKSDSSRPGRPNSQTIRTGSSPRTFGWNRCFPPECRVTEPSSNWKTSFGLTEQGRGHGFFCLVDHQLVRPRPSRLPLLPPTLSINQLGILPPYYPRRLKTHGPGLVNWLTWSRLILS